ncbi:Uma2 family endonuclease [Kitasatospora sp. NPDC048545]|uniref:Uma2 family endonuclease n=1 Tax=Kitasatospora sp. NPDC048545 TaxID=3157208 RepID=UPI0033F4EC42
MSGEAGEPQPDPVVFERGVVAEAGRLLPASAVTVAVEVVSRTSVHRNYRTEREMYAQGGIPAYLIVDPLKVCACSSRIRPLTRLPVSPCTGPNGPARSAIRSRSTCSASRSTPRSSGPTPDPAV